MKSLLEAKLFIVMKSFNFLIVEGRVVDPKTKIDLTSARLEELNKVDFDSLPFKNAIKEERGDGSRRIAVFSDVDCPFCRKLEKETISKLKDVTIYTFLYPLAIHPDAMNKSKKIWCSGNKTIAWNNYMLKNTLPKNDGNCDTPIEENLELARNLAYPQPQRSSYPVEKESREHYLMKISLNI